MVRGVWIVFVYCTVRSRLVWSGHGAQPIATQVVNSMQSLKHAEHKVLVGETPSNHPPWCFDLRTQPAKG